MDEVTEVEVNRLRQAIKAVHQLDAEGLVRAHDSIVSWNETDGIIMSLILLPPAASAATELSPETLRRNAG